MKTLKNKIQQADDLAQFQKQDIILVMESLSNELRFYFETRESYKELWEELCEDESLIGIEKVTVCEYRKPIKSFEDAKQKAIDTANKIGGTWHVVKLGKKHEYVHDAFIKLHDCKSLYEVKSKNKITSKNIKHLFPYMNREKRRDVLKQIKS